MTLLTQVEETAEPFTLESQHGALQRIPRWRVEFGLLWSLWHRDLLRLLKERSRWLGVVAQPLLFWLFIGAGIGDHFRVAGSTSSSYLTFFFPGVLMMVVLFTSIFGTISVIEDKKSGFLQGVLVSPGSPLSMVLGKIFGVTSIAMVQCLLLVAVAPFAGYALGQIHFVQLFLAVLLSAMSLTALSLMIAWKMPSVQAYHAVMSVVLIPLWIVSGAMFPRPDSWLGKVMLANPMTYAVDSARHALVGSASPLASTSPLTAFAALGAVLIIGLMGATWVCRRA